MRTKISGVLAAPALFAAPAVAQHSPDYWSVVQSVANMVGDGHAQHLAAKHGLQVMNVLWEDTGRFEGSSVGPNISDVTLEVSEGDGEDRQVALMPVIRHDNFTDKTADVRLDKFRIRVGNEKKEDREQIITLRQFLANPTRYMSLPGKGRIVGGTLLARRDTHALVSAQAAFLPIPKGGAATFYPVIFNYQSTAKNPAVLTLLITRQGTSMTIIDNARDTVSGGASWGQRLFFNAGGERAPLTAERISDVMERGQTQNGEAASSLGDDANVLMLVQVPLKYREPPRRTYQGMMDVGGPPTQPSAAPSMEGRRSSAPDMEMAVLGHGALEGPFTELDGLSIERDPRFPVRVTVQFYQATSHADIGAANMERLAAQIARVYEKGDYVGSLVVPTPEDKQRPTNWDGVSTAPAGTSFWSFPGLVERFFKHGNQGVGID